MEALPGLAWRMVCGEATAESARTCRVFTTLLARQQNTPLVQLLLTRQRESNALTLIFQMPHGVALPAGLTWQADEAPPQRLAFRSSDAAGVYAAMVVTEDLLARLREAKVLRLSYILDARRQTVSLPVPLEGFGAAVAEMLAAEMRAAETAPR
ncbi:invasion associated locus B family protein [Falsiroseomonas sp.]|uniref:invasion associated locus B family protein n=1 Tax=Falsiroseomonas sp. TaxID=2870721 RepID=UPI003F6F1E29